MEYQVPQFIEVEDKVVGSLTFRQFVYIAGTAGLCVVFFAYLPLVLALLLSVPVIALGVALSFYKVNGKSFIQILEAGFNYYTGSKFFLWKKEEPKAERPVSAAAAAAAAAQTAAEKPRGTPRLTRGKLSELAWELDISAGGAAGGKK